jgi:hypothetical protein
MGPDLVVDFTLLSGLSRDISGLDADLQENGSFVKARRDDVGSNLVFQALDGFESHWKKGRDDIAEKAENLASMLDGAVEAFTETEDDIASSFTAETETVAVSHNIPGGHP